MGFRSDTTRFPTRNAWHPQREPQSSHTWTLWTADTFRKGAPEGTSKTGPPPLSSSSGKKVFLSTWRHISIGAPSRFKYKIYYEQQVKRELNGIHICRCQCNERLKAKLMDLRVSYTLGYKFKFRSPGWWFCYNRIKKGESQGTNVTLELWCTLNL